MTVHARTTEPTEPTDTEALRWFWEAYAAAHDEIAEELTARFADHPEFGRLLAAMTPEQLRAQRAEDLERLRRAIEEGDWEGYFARLREQAVAYARTGIPFHSWMPVVSALRQPLLRRLFDRYGGEPDRLRRTLLAVEDLLGRALAAMGEAYLSEKERVIREQQQAIRELATPVLSLREGLLLLPLVGVVDSERARQVTEELLAAVARERARVVVIDVTGVPAVDSMVANHLMQTTEAARLMGARVIVTGISTANAQTLVRIGVDPSKLNTAGDLRSGIEEAERLLGDGAGAGG
ncbi:MAG TPA: STAS domain-containing protein [Actinomycetota bacterium]|nr:STAS domain-containing protein [Actinomycetota bacterium]